MIRLQIKDVARIRITLGLTQREFANKLGVSQGTINSLENEKIRKLNKMLESKLKKIVSKIQLINESEVEIEKKKLKTKGRFYGDRAIEMAKIGGKKGVINSIKNREPTKQEKEISHTLKLNNIEFELNSPVIAKNRRFIVDFLIPSKENPKIFLEVKDWKGKWGKHLQCAELAWRIIKLKQSYPNSKFYVWISGSLIDSEKEIIEEEASICFVNQPLKDLLKCLN